MAVLLARAVLVLPLLCTSCSKQTGAVGIGIGIAGVAGGAIAESRDDASYAGPLLILTGVIILVPSLIAFAPRDEPRPDSRVEETVPSTATPQTFFCTAVEASELCFCSQSESACNARRGELASAGNVATTCTRTDHDVCP